MFRSIPSHSCWRLVTAACAAAGKRPMSSSSSSPKSFEGGPWHEKFLLLQEYKAQHGNCLVPSRYVVERSKQQKDNTNKSVATKLGVWVSTQRQLYKKGRLSQNRREMLDDLGFSWDPMSERWEDNYDQLRQYAQREGHANVPQDYVTDDGNRLGRWLDWQRQNMRAGILDEDHADRLEALGIIWDPFVDQWEHHFDLLRQFHRREGHCDVPFGHLEDPSVWVEGDADIDADGTRPRRRDAEPSMMAKVKLGHWLVNQRQLAKRGKLDSDREERLTRLGVRWL